MISNNLSKKLQVKKKKEKEETQDTKKKIILQLQCVYINIVTAKSPKPNSIETQS